MFKERDCMPIVTPPQEVISSLGSAELYLYSEAMQYPFMQAAYEIEDMLASYRITSYDQLAERNDVTTRVVSRVCEMNREAKLSDHEVTVYNPHGRFFPLVDLKINGLIRPRIEIQKSTEPDAARTTRLSGTVLQLALGEFLDASSSGNLISLGVNVDAEITLTGQEIPGYWFIPFGGNDITITPPVGLN